MKYINHIFFGLQMRTDLQFSSQGSLNKRYVFFLWKVDGNRPTYLKVEEVTVIDPTFLSLSCITTGNLYNR